MRTVRCSGRLMGVGCLPGGCLPGGICPGVRVCQGCVSAQGCLPEGCLPEGCTPPPLWTDRHLWKHNLSTTTVADGKNNISFLNLMCPLPPAHLVCGKTMFSVMSVCPQGRSPWLPMMSLVSHKPPRLYPDAEIRNWITTCNPCTIDKWKDCLSNKSKTSCTVFPEKIPFSFYWIIDLNYYQDKRVHILWLHRTCKTKRYMQYIILRTINQ